jgi:hypothetical protein
MTIRAMVILVAICFSANAFARDKPAKVGNKPLVLVKPVARSGTVLAPSGTVWQTSPVSVPSTLGPFPYAYCAMLGQREAICPQALSTSFNRSLMDT